MKIALGIDIGGSGIKGAPVDLETGEFADKRKRIPTPERSTPDAVAQVCAEIVEHFSIPDGVPIGVTLPAPIVRGQVAFMANLHHTWKDVNVPELMSATFGREVYAVNDADAAGFAEVMYGAAKDKPGTIIVTTLGTGIGSAIVVDGKLVPNCELGHLEINGHDAETRASAAARAREDLSWKQWGKRLTTYYSTLEMLFSPDLFVVGGGVSKEHAEFMPFIKVKTPMVPAALRNAAGIVGAARLAADHAS